MGGRGSSSGIIRRVPNAKNATIADSKITQFLLMPGKKHYAEFISVGYSENNPEQLQIDLLNGLMYNSAKEYKTNEYGNKVYEVDMILGITKKKKFRTGWQIDKGSTHPRFITAHRIGEK